MKRTFILAHDTARRNASEFCHTAPDGWAITFSEPNRSHEQNNLQWPYLEGFSRQKQLCINGLMVTATPEDWKDALTGAYSGEMRMAAFDGKVIMLPQRTSKMGKRAFSEWMEFLIAMAAQMGVEPVFKSGRHE